MNKFLKKKAGVWSDFFGDMPSRGATSALKYVPYVGPVAQAAQTGVDLGATIHGFAQPTSDEDIEAFDNSVAKGFIPGVGQSRMLRRMLHNAKKTGGEHPTANVVGERYGGIVPTLASTIAGAAIGMLIKRQQGGNSRDMTMGAGIGALAGSALSGLASLAGYGIAGLTPRRTKAEQKEHDDNAGVANWLVPGVSSYNYAKRFGRLLGEQEEREAKKVSKSASALNKKAGAVLPF